MVYYTTQRRLTPYRASQRRTTPVTAFSNRREQANERSNARRRLTFQSPAPVMRSPYTRRTTTKKIGFTPGTGTSLTRITIDDWGLESAVGSRTIHQNELTQIPEKVAATTGIDRRERALINCLGFNLRIGLRNTNTSNSMVVRLAVVSPTDKNEINNNEFFKAYGDSRAKDFANNLDGHEYHQTPINTDNYAILWSTKCLLGPVFDSAGASANNYDRNTDNYKLINQWVPLNRQLRYDSNSGTSCSNKVFLLMWYDQVTSDTTTTPTNNVVYQRWGVTYWKDPGVK